MKTLITVLFPSLVCAASLCHAQTAPARVEAKLDPMAVAVAHDLLTAMRFKHTLAAELKTVAAGAPDALRKMATQKVAANPTLDAAARAKLVAAIEKKLPAADEALDQLFSDPALPEDITNETAKIYTRTFSIDEMQKTAAFYRTPAGAKMLALLPRANAESLAFAQRYLAPRTDKVLEALVKPAAAPVPAK